MSRPFDRIEDLFEPLPGDEPTPPPVSLDEATERLGFYDVYATLQRMTADAEEGNR